MIQPDAFLKVLRKLEELEINYMICGSVAAMFYGRPRLTKDMDVVLALRPVHAEAFAEAMTREGFYCPPAELLREEIPRAGQFNLLHLDSGLKIDCMLLGRDDFSLTEFKRRQKQRFGGTDFLASFAQPEDVILKKLEFYKEGGSQKHLEDIRGMLEKSGETFDMNYLKTWVKELGLEAEWKLVRP